MTTENQDSGIQSESLLQKAENVLHEAEDKISELVHSGEDKVQDLVDQTTNQDAPKVDAAPGTDDGTPEVAAAAPVAEAPSADTAGQQDTALAVGATQAQAPVASVDPSSNPISALVDKGLELVSKIEHNLANDVRVVFTKIREHL